MVLTPEIDDAEKFFRNRLSETKWILDEYIQQHPAMAAIYPSSVNTIRFHTILGKNGKVRAFYPYLRMGQGNSFVDNSSAGGLAILVHPETGVTFGKVIHEENRLDITAHPDTGKELVGMQIPQWDDLLKLLGEMARVCPKSRYLGWDMALSADRGWTVVEINSPPGESSWGCHENYGLAQEYFGLEQWALEGIGDDVLPDGQIEI